MPFARRKTFLLCAVSLTTLASVASIVPLTSERRANRSLFETTPQQSAALTTATTEQVRVAAIAPPAETPATASTFAPEAARRNGVLKDELRWTFGGKQQRGWALYVPLIQHLIGTDEGAASSNFAASLARWQRSMGLSDSGVLDEATLMKMIETWQARRLKSRIYPQPDQLLTVSPEEFYDSSRAEELRQVERQTYAAYKRMLAAATRESSLQLATRAEGELAANEKYLKIISAFRSREYQERLRKLEPGAGRAALAVNSPHFTGRALDIYVGGEPVETRDSNRALQTQMPVYRWLVRNAERFGFCPYFYEPWHWEYCAP